MLHGELSSSSRRAKEEATNGKMKILIAYDGSDCASAAITDLRRAGLPQQVEAIVLSVADVWVWSTVGNEAVVPVYARAHAGAWDKEREIWRPLPQQSARSGAGVSVGVGSQCLRPPHTFSGYRT